jgi:hypothetical protein
LSTQQRISPINFAAIAWNLGYHDHDSLSDAVRDWRTIIQRVRPNVILQDFGLTAGLVARHEGIRTVRIGTGYTCPPRWETPVNIPAFNIGAPDFRITIPTDDVFDRIMNSIAIACRANGVAVPSRWDEVVNGCEDDILATLPLLDPYANVRPHGRWDGIWSRVEDRDCVDGIDENSSRRFDANILAYLKPFSNWKPFFQSLEDLRVRVDLVPDSVNDELLKSCNPHWVRICTGFRNIPAAARRGRMLINNGNHGSTAVALLNGMPVVACPLFFEQRLTAEAITRVGVGAFIDVRSPAGWTEQLRQAFASRDLRNRSQRFANRYETLTPAVLDSITQRIVR